jgi:hypothetical protein
MEDMVEGASWDDPTRQFRGRPGSHIRVFHASVPLTRCRFVGDLATSEELLSNPQQHPLWAILKVRGSILRMLNKEAIRDQRAALLNLLDVPELSAAMTTYIGALIIDEKARELFFADPQSALDSTDLTIELSENDKKALLRLNDGQTTIYQLSDLIPNRLFGIGQVYVLFPKQADRLAPRAWLDVIWNDLAHKNVQFGFSLDEADASDLVVIIGSPDADVAVPEQVQKMLKTDFRLEVIRIEGTSAPTLKENWEREFPAILDRMSDEYDPYPWMQVSKTSQTGHGGVAQDSPRHSLAKEI